MSNLNLEKVVQRYVYTAIVNHDYDHNGVEFYEVSVREFEIQVLASSLQEAVDKATILLQVQINRLFELCQSIPTPLVLSCHEVEDIYKYGQQLISIDGELIYYLRMKG